MRYVVIDIEASGFDGFPIEVGWCDQDGNCEGHVIRPAWDWTDWDNRSERVHGISREYLADQGKPFDAVAKLVADMLARCRADGVMVASDNPDYDREWLIKLLRRADIEDDVTLANIQELYEIAVKPMFAVLPQAGLPDFNADHEPALVRRDAIIQTAKTQV
jgi:DNA polymerase III epsilon subunit-like protein